MSFEEKISLPWFIETFFYFLQNNEIISKVFKVWNITTLSATKIRNHFFLKNIMSKMQVEGEGYYNDAGMLPGVLKNGYFILCLVTSLKFCLAFALGQLFLYCRLKSCILWTIIVIFPLKIFFNSDLRFSCWWFLCTFSQTDPNFSTHDCMFHTFYPVKHLRLSFLEMSKMKPLTIFTKSSI